MSQPDHPKSPLKDASSPEIELGDGQITVSGIAEMPLRRNFGILSIIAVGYNMSNSWVAIASSFAIAIQSGGALSLLYGIITVAVAMLFTGLTLAELASVYPTAGGQYHFTSIMAPSRWARELSYFSGLAAIFAWITLVASICLATTKMIMAIAIRWSPTYEPQRWHYFLVYQGFNAAIVLYNIFLTNRTLWVYNFGCASLPIHQGSSSFRQSSSPSAPFSRLPSPARSAPSTTPTPAQSGPNLSTAPTAGQTVSPT